MFGFYLESFEYVCIRKRTYMRHSSDSRLISVLILTCTLFFRLFSRLDNRLYIEVVFNQIAPDYLEGLLLVMPAELIDQEAVYQVADRVIL